MRPFRLSVLIAILAAGMIVAVISWEKLWLTPRVEQAQRRPVAVEAEDTELPAACLEELSDLKLPGSGTVDVVQPARPHEPSQASGTGSNSPGSELLLTVLPKDEPRRAAPEVVTAQPIPAAQPSQAKAEISQVSANVPQSASARAATPIEFAGAAANEALREAARKADLLTLMRQLRSDDLDQRARSRAELVRRGFNEVDLELARQLFSPEVETRKQLARALPRLESVDAARWLMWLVEDPEPEVRMVAVTTLATTGDPAVLERLGEIAGKDSDPRIRSLADQISRQHDLALSRGDSTARRGSGNPLR